MTKPMISYDSEDLIADLSDFIAEKGKDRTLWALIINVDGSEIIIDWNESIDGLKMSNNETAKSYKAVDLYQRLLRQDSVIQ